MIHRLVVCLAIASLTFVAPRPVDAAGTITHTFVAIDAVELQYAGGPYQGGYQLIITGVLSGGSTPTTRTFGFAWDDYGTQQSERCERMAQIVMSKPGKFKLGIGVVNPYPDRSTTVCKLMSAAP